MSGNIHPVKRCDTCEFWAPGDQYPYDLECHPDDREGACHRYAPRPTLGDFEHEVMKHLTIISWKHAEGDKKDFKDWEECEVAGVSWPSTTGSEWCGDWQERVHQTKGMNWPPVEKARN